MSCPKGFKLVGYCRVEDWKYTEYPEGCFVHEKDESDGEDFFPIYVKVDGSDNPIH